MKEGLRDRGDRIRNSEEKSSRSHKEKIEWKSCNNNQRNNSSEFPGTDKRDESMDKGSKMLPRCMDKKTSTLRNIIVNLQSIRNKEKNLSNSHWEKITCRGMTISLSADFASVIMDTIKSAKKSTKRK